MDALSSRSIDIFPLSDAREFINFPKSVTNSPNIWEFIDLLRMWLKCHPVDEMQEISDIDSATFIDFSSGINPLMLQDLDGFVFLEIELSSIFINISSLWMILKNSNAKIALFRLTEAKSTLIGRCEYLFEAHV